MIKIKKKSFLIYITRIGSGKEKVRAPVVCKKFMRTLFWDMKRTMIIDFFKKIKL